MSERQSPFHAVNRELGATFTTVGGCRLVERFTDVAAECRAVREACGVIDRLDRACLAATGADAKAFLHRMLTNDVAGLQPGQGRYATLLNSQGQMLADLQVLQLDDHLLLDTGASLIQRLRDGLDHYIIADDVALEERVDQLFALDLAGPQAAELLRAAGISSLPAHEFDHREAKLNQAPVRIVRLSETGEQTFRLWVAAADAESLWAALRARRPTVPWQPVGHAALNILRTEAGIPWYGAEMNERTLPPEAGLEDRALSYTKGCYVGQEIIERIRSRGHVNRRLAGLELSTSSLPSPGTKLLADGKAAGHLTTAVDSPLLGRRLALGYLRREHLAAGTVLQVEGGGQARVAPLPFYRARSV